MTDKPIPRTRKNKSEDLDFQMAFYEGILKENPNFVDALTVLGEIYTKKGRYAEGLRVDKRLSKLRPQNPIVYYNLACSLSLSGDVTSSFKALKRAVELGYEDISLLNNDPDLLNLRRDKRFEEFIKKIEKSSVGRQDER